ncbi:hypothetical protein PG997_012681 [Apiospora hydei]|uniref:Aminoglycoside phosphotransferase domain-containing protein n=1 Tax=Apiospora hydei TaxID=1337664 RepID=A0ABR1V418_9PEZI
MWSQHPSRRPGLGWSPALFGLVPKWKREPSLDAVREVCCERLGLPFSNINGQGEDACVVSFLAAGAFNRVYTVDSAKGKYVMRVSLPVDPIFKTRGEVSTLRFIRENTTIPVPEVIAFDDTRSSKIGFEWILMEFISGQSLRYRWRKLTMDQKTTLVRRVAEMQTQLFQFRSIGRSPTLRGIGTLGTEKTFDVPGRIVTFPFIRGDCYDYDVPRGPFRSSHDWLDSHLQLICLQKQEEIEHAEDDEDKALAMAGLEAAQQLMCALPKIFPPSPTYDHERTAIYHHDLSEMNIMVDEQGNITGIVDWECVCALPSWVITRPPVFIHNNRKRKDKPLRDEYADETEEDRELSSKYDGGHHLDNEGKNELYWIHLKEYETTQLKKVYDARMEQLLPAWGEMMKDAELQMKFYLNLENAAKSWATETTCVWAKAIVKGIALGRDPVSDSEGDGDGADDEEEEAEADDEAEDSEAEEGEGEKYEDENHDVVVPVHSGLEEKASH